jgi:hypothetical protein
MRLPPLAAIAAALALASGCAAMAERPAAATAADEVVPDDATAAADPDRAPGGVPGPPAGKGKKDKAIKAANFVDKLSGKWLIGVIPANVPCASIPVELGLEIEVRGVPPFAALADGTRFARRSEIEATNGETMASVCWTRGRTAAVPAAFAYHLIEEVETAEPGGDVAPQ